MTRKNFTVCVYFCKNFCRRNGLIFRQIIAKVDRHGLVYQTAC